MQKFVTLVIGASTLGLLFGNYDLDKWPMTNIKKIVR